MSFLFELVSNFPNTSMSDEKAMAGPVEVVSLKGGPKSNVLQFSFKSAEKEISFSLPV